MKTILGIIVLGIIVAGGYYLVSRNKTITVTDNNQTQNNAGSSTTEQPASTPTPEAAPVTSDHPVATIETSMGAIVITLDHTAAPQTVENFVKLANKGFYNGLKFHRVIPHFVIQGGDPLGTGTGGPGYTIPAEIKLTHKLGAIGMASTAAKGDSNGSQFYIVVEENPQTKSLDGNYTIFGYVTTGMDVATKISNVPTEPGDYPLQDVIIKKISIKE